MLIPRNSYIVIKIRFAFTRTINPSFKTRIQLIIWVCGNELKLKELHIYKVKYNESEVI